MRVWSSLGQRRKLGAQTMAMFSRLIFVRAMLSAVMKCWKKREIICILNIESTQLPSQLLCLCIMKLQKSGHLTFEIRTPHLWDFEIRTPQLETQDTSPLKSGHLTFETLKSGHLTYDTSLMKLQNQDTSLLKLQNQNTSLLKLQNQDTSLLKLQNQDTSLLKLKSGQKLWNQDTSLLKSGHHLISKYLLHYFYM